MEENKKQKVGAGILTISIIQIIVSVLGIASFIMYLSPSYIEFITQSGVFTEEQILTLVPPKSILIISIIMLILIIVSLILILRKKAIGIYIYYIVEIISIIEGIVINGFSLAGLIGGLILPVLMGIFIYRKKELYFNK